jgi:hypothetical protein
VGKIYKSEVNEATLEIGSRLLTAICNPPDSAVQAGKGLVTYLRFVTMLSISMLLKDLTME